MGERKTDTWIDVEDRKPPHGHVVHLRGRTDSGKRVDLIGWWLEAEREECACDTAYTDCVCEYNESRDAYFYPPGFYEQILNWGDFSSIAVCEHDVTHWRELW